MSSDLHKTASCMVRDCTIMAKQLYEVSMSYRAMADTWRLVLDDTEPPVLQTKNREDGKPGAPTDPFGPSLFEGADGVS